MSDAPVLEPDDFHYGTMEETEEDVRYVPGGYHPAIIGNILGESPQRQYRLMHKLGWGSYATVWLAQRTDEPNTFVAVKITTAEDDDARTEEAEMLRKAAKLQPDDPSHVVNLLDHFKLHGPNGIHNVIVTDVVIPILSLPTQGRPAWRKAAAYGVAQAMAQLHANQIVHGDWHLGNIGIAMPQLANQNPNDVMRSLKPPEVCIVLTTDPAKQTASLPAYLTYPCSNIGSYYQKIAGSDPPQMKIFDFGAAHKIGTPPRMFQCAAEGCAPEVSIAITVQKEKAPTIDPPADVWALGSSIYEIVTGGVLFYFASIRTVPRYACKLAGHVPPHWEEWATLFNISVTQADAAKAWAEIRTAVRKGCESEEDANALVRLLKTVLVLDPAERPTAAQIVNDPWFQSVSGAEATVTAET